MIDFTERVEIDAPPLEVWRLLRDVEAWWIDSNPDHDSLEVISDGELREGSELRIRETIAGVPGEATGVVTDVQPEESITWEAPEARYRLFGIRLCVSEGVEWRIASPDDRRSLLSAHVWARFPEGVKGWLVERAFRHLLNGVEKDRAHTRTELRYLKRRLEDGEA